MKRIKDMFFASVVAGLLLLLFSAGAEAYCGSGSANSSKKDVLLRSGPYMVVEKDKDTGSASYVFFRLCDKNTDKAKTFAKASGAWGLSLPERIHGNRLLFGYSGGGSDSTIVCKIDISGYLAGKKGTRECS